MSKLCGQEKIFDIHMCCTMYHLISRSTSITLYLKNVSSWEVRVTLLTATNPVI